MEEKRAILLGLLTMSIAECGGKAAEVIIVCGLQQMESGFEVQQVMLSTGGISGNIFSKSRAQVILRLLNYIFFSKTNCLINGG